MTRRTALLCAVFASSIAAKANADDDIFGPGRTPLGPRLDFVELQVSSDSPWRGLALGPAVEAEAGIGLWGYPVIAAGKWGVSTRAEGRYVWSPQPNVPLTHRGGLSLDISRLWSDVEGVVRLGAYGESREPTDAPAFAPELSLLVRGLPVPWLPEVLPTLEVEATQNLASIGGGLFLSGQLRWSIPLRIIEIAPMLGVSWNNYEEHRTRVVYVDSERTLLAWQAGAEVGLVQYRLMPTLHVGWLRPVQGRGGLFGALRLHYL